MNDTPTWGSCSCGLRTEGTHGECLDVRYDIGTGRAGDERMTLVEFLTARLRDDERLIGEYEAYMSERAAAAGSYVPVTPPGWQPGEPFDPDRVMREVVAKRTIVERYGSVVPHGPAVGAVDMTKGASGALRDALYLLALPYADHPDYRQEWRP